jgi:putative GTP pyrophosphokinase
MNDNPIEQLRRIRHQLTRFMMMYQFALLEMETKVEILQQEFQLLHDYNPIEHTKSRLKDPESVMRKLMRKGGATSLADIRSSVKDIAGLRITCSFLSDIYRIADMLRNQDDLTIVSVKDYLQQPKPNGYKSLHLLIEVPVFMSDRQEAVPVEVQIRTIAMDFWASLEHKIFYKFNGSVPDRLLAELKEAADTASELDEKMERLQREVDEIKHAAAALPSESDMRLLIDRRSFAIPEGLLRLMEEE